ncbi:MAG: hypothetical protein BWY63_02740 [Chloroflexi bacterium ADurb.Bin360]|nr:MAG: hypothetical protein BWY63_02740 [Chloroflexi bacterium ADurb.Bin360]
MIIMLPGPSKSLNVELSATDAVELDVRAPEPYIPGEDQGTVNIYIAGELATVLNEPKTLSVSFGALRLTATLAREIQNALQELVSHIVAIEQRLSNLESFK